MNPNWTFLPGTDGSAGIKPTTTSKTSFNTPTVLEQAL